MTARRELGSAATEAIDPAFKMALGVSIIAQIRRAVRRAGFTQRPGGDHDPSGAVDLRQENGVRSGDGGGDEIVLSPRRVRPVNADDDLTASEAAGAHGLNDLFAGGDFLVGGD